MCVRFTHFIKYFITMEVMATGRWSFRDLTTACFVTGMIAVDLTQVGTVVCSREMLNRLVNTVVSWPAQCFRTCHRVQWLRRGRHGLGSPCVDPAPVQVMGLPAAAAW